MTSTSLKSYCSVFYECVNYSECGSWRESCWCFPRFSPLADIGIDPWPWLRSNSQGDVRKKTPSNAEEIIHNAHEPVWDIAFHLCLSGSVDYTGIKCVCCVYTLSHAYTHTQGNTPDNTFIWVAGLHRDKARLLILTHWLNTHIQYTLYICSHCVHTQTHTHI